MHRSSRVNGSLVTVLHGRYTDVHMSSTGFEKDEIYAPLIRIVVGLHG
jgi:hypothetical protein